MTLTKWFYGLVFAGMGLNGYLYLAWFLSPPNPDRVGFWFLIYFVVLPYLLLLGIWAVVAEQSLNISWLFGVILLVYAGALLLLVNATQLGLGWILAALPQNSYEVIHVGLFSIALIWLLFLVRR